MRRLLCMHCALVLPFLLSQALGAPVEATQALVFVGATGDNALRDNGVWQGLFEAFCGGVFERTGGVTILAAMNEPHTQSELSEKVLASLGPLFRNLQETEDWSCKRSSGDCRPEALLSLVSVNIQKGRDPCTQAASMAPSMTGYETITMYLSVPPSVFGNWVRCGLEHWSNTSRVHTAVEKPFGSGSEDAAELHRSITDGGLPDDRLHLVDHFLSFFMSRHLPAFRRIAESQLGIELSRRTIGEVVVKQNEVRGLEGRGSFFDGVGQVRDMVQSHLLQMLTLVLMDPDAESRAGAKQAILNSTSLVDCCFGQYDGFLLEPKLGYHHDFADATWCDVLLRVDTDDWREVPMHIATGKDMGELVYTITLQQRDGPGTLTFSIGKEETGVAGVSVTNWPLAVGGDFDAPAPGFGDAGLVMMSPAVVNGTGDIAAYNDPGAYFPKPYAVMVAALLSRDYASAFVTWPECYRSWEIVTAGVSPTACLDPPPERVRVYRSPLELGEPCQKNSCSSESLCWLTGTVQDLYDDRFACTPANDAAYSGVDFYAAKCKTDPDEHDDGPTSMWIAVGVAAVAVVVISVVLFVFFLRRSRRDVESDEPPLTASLQPPPVARG